MKKIVILGGCLLALGGCATTQAPQPANITYVEAQQQPPIEPEQVIVEVHTPMPMPGQLQLKPGVASLEPEVDEEKMAADMVIDGANEGARNKPNLENYFNSIMQYNYAEGALYQLYAAPLKFTDIQLQPGERLMGDGPICGDTVRWVMGLGISKKDGKDQQHIFLKPTESNLHTTFTINTDKRTYHMEIHSYKDTYMAAVKWRYPQSEVSQLRAKIQQRQIQEEAVTSTVVALDNINNNYSINITGGNKKIEWRPLMVFDDGHKTFIHFPKGMLEREAPVLFVMSSEDETQLVNYRVKNDYYIVDRLFSHAELRLGQKNQDVVSIKSLYASSSRHSFQNTDL